MNACQGQLDSPEQYHLFNLSNNNFPLNTQNIMSLSFEGRSYENSFTNDELDFPHMESNSQIIRVQQNEINQVGLKLFPSVRTSKKNQQQPSYAQSSVEDSSMKLALLDEEVSSNKAMIFEKRNSFDCWEQEEPGFSDVRSFGIKLNRFDSSQKNPFSSYRSSMKSFSRNQTDFAAGNARGSFQRGRHKNSAQIWQRSSSTSYQGINDSILGRTSNHFNESRTNLSHTNLTEFQVRNQFRKPSSAATHKFGTARPESKIAVDDHFEIQMDSILDASNEEKNRYILMKRFAVNQSSNGSTSFIKMSSNQLRKEQMNMITFPDNLNTSQSRSNKKHHSRFSIEQFRSQSKSPDTTLLQIKGTTLSKDSQKNKLDCKEFLPQINQKYSQNNDYSHEDAFVSSVQKDAIPTLFSIQSKEMPSIQLQFRPLFRNLPQEKREESSSKEFQKKESLHCFDNQKSDLINVNNPFSSTFINLNEQIPIFTSSIKENSISFQMKTNSKSLSPPKLARHPKVIMNVQKGIDHFSDQNINEGTEKQFLQIKNLAPLKRIFITGGQQRNYKTQGDFISDSSQRSPIGSSSIKLEAEETGINCSTENKSGQQYDEAKHIQQKLPQQSSFQEKQSQFEIGSRGINFLKRSKPIGLPGLKGSKLVSLHQSRSTKAVGNCNKEQQQQMNRTFQETIYGFNQQKSSTNQNQLQNPYQQWMNRQFEQTVAQNPIEEQVIDKKVSAYFVRKVKTPFTQKNLEKIRIDFQYDQISRTLPSSYMKHIDTESNSIKETRSLGQRQNISPNGLWYRK